MSSHREAPEISKDPVADNADVYAFVSPDKPDTVTIISNFVPLQGPAGGPNFFEFGDDVLYSIYIDNDGDAQAGHRVPVPVQLDPAEPEHVPLQHGPDHVARRARTGTRGSSTRSRGSTSGKGADSTATANGNAARRPGVGRRASSSPPCSARTCRARRATSARARRPNYRDLASAAIQTLPTGEKVFCRAAERPVLRRPGVDLRPRRPAAVQRPRT